MPEQQKLEPPTDERITGHFEVRCSYPLDDNFEIRDKKLRNAAGRVSDFSGGGMGKRDLGWYVKSFKEAIAMKDRLEKTHWQLTVWIREQ